MSRQRGGGARLRSLGIAVLLGLLAISAFASLARADGTPNISASVSSSSQLYGQPVHVDLGAANPSGQPYGYNLSYRVVLPQGVSYSGGSTVAPEVIADQPAAGQTTLIFGNVADLSPGSENGLGFDLAYDQSIWHAGEAFPVKAQAFVNSDPRYVPKFTAAGLPDGPEPNSFTGFTTEVSGDQKLNAIKVSAEEPSPEGEILRGVHEDQTVYTLKVENNLVNPTTEAKLDAFLPAGLEYLGCGAPGGAGTDNTTNAIATNSGSPEEYPGSGPIKVETLAECATPELVETEELDPDGPGGPMPFGVYTHVRWDVGALTPGQVKTFKYRAAIPIRQNVLAFTGGPKPSGASGEQAVNLDNNTGPETSDEESLPTLASASGTYQGGTPTATSDETILDRTAEDWAVHKAVEAERLEQGQNVKWNLTFETSEYKYVNDGVVIDTLPNGLCPLGPENFTNGNDPADAECNPVSGKEPSAPYTSAVENADGTWTLTWDATDFTELQHTAINAKFTLSFWSHTRTHYQENFLPTTPILSRDRVSNGVTTEAEGFARCVAPEATNCENPAAKINHQVADGTKIVDASSAELEAISPTLEKWVAAGPGSNCQTATYVKTVPAYHPGDVVCWKLRITFPGTLDTDAQTIADFLPPETTYVAGSDEPHGENNVNAVLDASGAAAGVLNWTAENSTVPAGGQVFERVIATKVAPTGTVVSGDLKGNLLKFASANTPGESEALRAEANYEITTPILNLTKGVYKINGQPAAGNGPNVDGGSVNEGDTVEYRIDVENEGKVPALNVAVRDLLEDEITCADFKEASDSGACTGGHVDWTFAGPIAPKATKTFFYKVEIPAQPAAGKRIDDHAGVVSYQSETNEEPTPGLFTYVPEDNIAGLEAPGAPNIQAADDTSFVETPGLQFSKTRTTAVSEAGNNEASQATIGEAITYTSTLVVPEGTTLYNGNFKDTLGNERFAELLNAETKINAVKGTPPGGTEAIDSLNLGYEVTFPSAYNNPAGSGDDVIEFIITARVANTAANSRVAPKQTLPNVAHLTYTEQGGGAQAKEASVNTEIVEPDLGVTKSDDDPDKRVQPGQVVEYTVTTTNNSGTRVSTAHDTETFDQLPNGLILLGAGDEPLADNAEVPGSEGAIWNATTRTIKRVIPTLAPGESKSFSYRAEVEDPAVAGSVLTNSVSSHTASLAEGTSPIRRTSGSGYEASTEDTVRLVGATIEKTSTPDKATPGNPLTYTLNVTIPASVNLYDTTVKDEVPAGVEFDSYETECVSGCSLVNPIQAYDPVEEGGKLVVAWDLGDIPALPEPQVIKFTYQAHLREANRGGGGDVVAGDTEVNAAIVGSNLTDKGPFDKDNIPKSFEETSPQAKTTTTVVEPELTLDKQIKVGAAGSFGDGPVTAHGNDLLSYRLVVTNTGTSPAYNAEITDLLDPALTNPVVATQTGLNVLTPWTSATHSMTLEIEGPIPAGGSATIEYTAGLVEQKDLHDGEQVVNTADLAKYFGVPKTERDANPSWEFRQYEGNEDSTEAVLDFPAFGLVKTTGLSGNPDSGNAELNQEFPWRIVASNTSATAGATDVVVTDTLPPKWSYVAGTAKFDGAAAPDPTITAAPSGDKLVWTLPSLAAASSKTITFGAKPALGASTTEANVNTAQVTGATDEGGETEVGEVPYSSAPDDAEATLILPDLKLEKTPDEGPAVAGSPSSANAFTIKVTNSGPGIARDLEIEDVTSSGMTYTAGSATANPATGFSEISVAADPGGGQLIHWHLDSLASGTSVTIKMPVAIDADLADGTTLTNLANVTSEELPTPDSEAEDDGSLKVSTEADMAIEKSGDAAYVAGEQYTWHLGVKNLGPSDAQAVEVKDPLPAGVTFVSATTPCELSGGEVKCVIGTAAVGFDQSYDVTVEVEPGTDTSPLDNTATVSTTTTDPDPSNDADSFGPSASPEADVWIKKSAEPGLILKTQETEYTLEVGNDGPSTARDVKLVDPMPAGMEIVSADPPCTVVSGTVSCEFGDLEPGQKTTVQVKAKGITNGTWPNTATVSTTTPEPATPEAEENNHATSEVIVGPVVDMTVDKTGPATVAAGGQVTWTIEVSNDGPDDATGVMFEDTLPAGVVFVSADPGCTAQPGGKVSCDLGDMAFGESTERHITVTVPTALADQTLVNTVTVKADQGELEEENNHSEAKTTVGPAADLAITKTGPAKVTADGDVTWTLTATNNGPSAATGVKVDDTLPGGVELRSAHPSQGACGGSLSCALGTLAKGASARIEVTAHVPDSLGGQKLTNNAKVSGEEPDPNPGNNSASATTEVDPKPAPKTPPAAVTSSGFNLSLEKKLVGPAHPRRGDVLTYRLTVTNQGPASAKQVVIEDDLPAALEYVSASVPGGKCAVKGSVVTCKLASLAAGATKVETLKARVVGSGKVKNTASVGASGTERKRADNEDAAVADVSAGGTVLKLIKKRLGPGRVEAGKKVKFRIRVVNIGRVAATGVTVCDRLPNAMSFVKVRKAKFVKGNACWTIARLGARKSRRFTVVTRIDAGVGDRKLRNVAKLEAANAPDRRAAAPVRVKSSGPGREGGVTG